MKLKDLVIIAVVVIVSFPVLYLTMLIVSGQARIELGMKKETIDKAKKVEVIKFTARKDSLALVNSRLFTAIQQERSDLEAQRKHLQDQQQRVELVSRELETQKASIARERERLESLVSRSDSLEGKKVKQLAKVYGAMRPAEAAQIIETLEEKLAVKILNAITDDRQKARILSLLSKEKAGRISSAMGR